MNKTLFIALAFIAAFTAPFLQADTSNLRFIDGWIKQLPAVVPVRAGYLQIDNPDKQSHEVIAFQSDAFERIEMHESRMQDDIMTMVELQSLILPADGTLELKPGGKHLMLINPTRSLQIGEDFYIVITFADETSQRMRMEVRK
jgi:hypothetical protein